MSPSLARAAPFLVALVLLSGGREGLAQTIERQPYLQMLGPNSVTVVWTTLEPTSSMVRYGSSPDALDRVAGSGTLTSQHEIRLAGLSATTRYFYSVGTFDGALAGGDGEHYFVTAPPFGVPAKFRAWIVGDSGTGGSTQRKVRDAMLTATALHRPDLFLHMGDIAYSIGSTEQFTTNFFAAYEGILAHTAVWPTMGNHEGFSSRSATQTGPYYTAYVLPTSAQVGGLPSGTEAYYSFDHANVHFVVLDSHDSPRDAGGAMLTWMQADLAATDRDWIFAYWHHPPYTKGTHDSDVESHHVDMRENAIPILEAAGVDLVLGGHSHSYERSYLVDGAYDTPTTAAGHVLDQRSGEPLSGGPYEKPRGVSPRAGAVYVVAGHGGEATGLYGGPHPLMFRSEARNGSCILDVQGNRVALSNVRDDGVVSDRFTIVKGEGLVVGTPDGGELLAAGTIATIRWATVGASPLVDVAYSTDAGATWTPIERALANTGEVPWTVPATLTTRAIVRVARTGAPSVFDESNAEFAIVPAPPDAGPADSGGEEGGAPEDASLDGGRADASISPDATVASGGAPGSGGAENAGGSAGSMGGVSGDGGRAAADDAAHAGGAMGAGGATGTGGEGGATGEAGGSDAGGASGEGGEFSAAGGNGAGGSSSGGGAAAGGAPVATDGGSSGGAATGGAAAQGGGSTAGAPSNGGAQAGTAGALAAGGSSPEAAGGGAVAEAGGTGTNAAGSAGIAAGGGDATGDGAAGAPSSGKSSDDGGCGCRLATRETSGLALEALAGAIGAALARRRRR